MPRQVDLYATYACVTCRKQKRKCTKELPKCSLCERLHKRCNYADDRPNAGNEDVSDLQSRVEELEQQLGKAVRTIETSQQRRQQQPSFDLDHSLSGTQNDIHTTSRSFPVVFFLDPEVTRLSRPTIPRPKISIPEEILAVLGRLDQYSDVTSKFFSTTHLWLPFVAKKRMELALSNPSYELKPDTAALLLAMALLTSDVSSSGPQSYLYELARGYVNLLEFRNCMSIQLIQAYVLVSLYEIGHGVYPAAYLSSAKAARLGQAYGIDNRRGAPQMGPAMYGSWVEDQEAKRTWWAMMILDRFVNLGFEGHALATGDSRRDQMLPADCRRWDNGQMSTAEPLYLFSSVNLLAGPFARTCQAANLMGRFIKHRNDDQLEPKLRSEDALQLHRTITAFSKLLSAEVEANPLQCAGAAALTYSTLLHFYDPYSCSETMSNSFTSESVEMQTAAIAGLQTISLEVIKLSQIMSPYFLSDLETISPFLIECLFQGATTLAWQIHENGPGELLTAFHNLKDHLITLSKRWKLAEVYLDILHQTKAVLYPDNDLL